MAMSDEGQSERIEQLIGALRDENEALKARIAALEGKPAAKPKVSKAKGA